MTSWLIPFVSTNFVSFLVNHWQSNSIPYIWNDLQFCTSTNKVYSELLQSLLFLLSTNKNGRVFMNLNFKVYLQVLDAFLPGTQTFTNSIEVPLLTQHDLLRDSEKRYKVHSPPHLRSKASQKNCIIVSPRTLLWCPKRFQLENRRRERGKWMRRQ